MKIVMYGTGICPDCVLAKKQLAKSKNIELDYRDITKTTATLREFLSYRDHEALFDPVKEEGKVGIPFFILEDGTKTFDIYDALGIKKQELDSTARACSIDGKGNC
ncbi:MAG: glutaredoxin [Lachnospiraceae bacterium]|nr:glutaredoxin [Lachnospiraceae bacterium]